MLRVAIVGPLPPLRSGIANYTALLAQHWLTSANVRVYSFRQQYPDWLFPGQSQFTYDHLPGIEVPNWPILIPWWPPSWRDVVRDWSKWQPNLVVIQWWIPFMAPMTAWLIAQARRLQARIAIICHNVLPHETLPGTWRLTRWTLAGADRLIVHSISEQEKAYRVAPGRPIIVVPHPSYAELLPKIWSREEARAALKIDKPMLLFFGIVRPYKGVADLLDALPAITAEVDSMLYIVGEVWGSVEPYQQQIRRLGLEKRVCLVNRYVSNAEAAMYFAAADLVILPYRHATGSGVLQLALGAGIPVIATRTGGMAEAVLDGKTGFLVEPGDIHGLGAAVVRFFKDDCATSFRLALRNEASRFTWENIILAVTEDVQFSHD